MLSILQHTKPARPWRSFLFVLAVVAAIGLLLLLVEDARMSARSAGGAATGVDGSRLDSAAAAAAVESFAAFVADRGMAGASTPDNAYAIEGLRKLADALEALERRQPAPDERYVGIGSTLRHDADRLTGEADTANRAEIAHASFALATTALIDLQVMHYAGLERATDELRQAAEAIRDDRALPDQMEAVQMFFDRASDVMRGMAEVGPWS